MSPYAVAAIVIGIAFLLSARRAYAGVSGGRSQSFLDFAESIAYAEGYGVPGAIPTVRNNPGDLKLTGDGSITTFPTVQAGWDALYHQLEIMRDGTSSYYRPDMRLIDMARIWTTTEQSAWVSNVVRSMQSRGHSVTIYSILGDVLA